MEKKLNMNQALDNFKKLLLILLSVNKGIMTLIWYRYILNKYSQGKLCQIFFNIFQTISHQKKTQKTKNKKPGDKIDETSRMA